MNTRVFMLGFILSRLLNPVSYSVFLFYFILVAIGAGGIIPEGKLQWFAEMVGPYYGPLVFFSILVNAIVFGLLINFIYRVVVEGKYIVKRSTLGFLLAISSVHVFAFFCMNALPKVSAKISVEQQLAFWFENSVRVIDLSSLLIMGIMLALYIGVLSREKFQKNIGFVDDTLPE